MQRKRLLLAAGLLLVSSLFLFRDFLFGNAVLLYQDIGSDSLNSYYPDFVHLSNYLRTEGYPSWSFAVGMGQDLAYAAGFLVWQPVTWLPKEWIAFALIYQQVVKVVMAGCLFVGFLQLRRVSFPAQLLGGLLLSFSAYICMGACWYPLSDEVVGFAAILLGIEVALQTGRYLLFTIAVALIGLINPFFLYLGAFFLVAYVALRSASAGRLHLRRLLTLAALALLGVFLAAFITLPHLGIILASPRGSGLAAASSILRARPLAAFESASHYATAILRFFANDMAGAGDDFRGWQNYLEAPIYYCGLISLLLFPQFFRLGSRRNRFIAAAFLIGILIPIAFPWFRYLFWLFQGDY
ncbi:MAG: YfhO family protein, partial [Verrucomicrobiota bacterium]|nr:YfhO family protein [Verrucomicrobiota bacterium]